VKKNDVSYYTELETKKKTTTFYNPSLLIGWLCVMEIDQFCSLRGNFFENTIIIGGCWQGKVNK